MKKRIADSLIEFGCEVTVEEFRTAVVDVKAEHYAGFTDEELTYTRDEAGTYCAHVRKRLGCPRLTRPFILPNLVGLRKHRKCKAVISEI